MWKVQRESNRWSYAQIPRRASSRLEFGSSDVPKELRRSKRRGSVVREPRLDGGLVLLECARSRRRPLIEQAIAAPENGGPRRVQEDRGANSRRDVAATDDAVAIDPPAEFKVPTRARLPPILREGREVGAANLLGTAHGEVEPPR